MLFRQFTKDAIPVVKSFRVRKSVSYHTVAEIEPNAARESDPLRDSGSRVCNATKSAWRTESWLRIVARLFAVA